MREDWLQLGDHNTKYFHACATQKRRRNAVEQIKDKDGQICMTPETIEAAFVSYYTKLFTTSRPHNVESCTSVIDGKVTMEMNNKLTASFMVDEVK